MKRPVQDGLGTAVRAAPVTTKFPKIGDQSKSQGRKDGEQQEPSDVIPKTKEVEDRKEAHSVEEAEGDGVQEGSPARPTAQAPAWHSIIMAHGADPTMQAQTALLRYLGKPSIARRRRPL